MGLKDWAKNVQKELGGIGEELALAGLEEAGKQVDGTVEWKATKQKLPQNFVNMMIESTKRSLIKFKEPKGAVVVYEAQAAMPDIGSIDEMFKNSKLNETKGGLQKIKVALRMSIRQCDAFTRGINELSQDIHKHLDAKVDRDKAYMKLNWESGKSIVGTKADIEGRIRIDKGIAERILAKAEKMNVGEGFHRSEPAPKPKGKSVEISFGGIKKFWGKKK